MIRPWGYEWCRNDSKKGYQLGAMTKKVVSFLWGKWVTPSVAAPGDTNLSDATDGQDRT